MRLDNSGGRLSSRQRGLLIAILLLGFGLRIYDLGAKSLWYDEGFSIRFARHLTSFSDAFDTTFTSDPPLFPLLVRGWDAVVQAVVGNPTSPWSDFSLRLLPFFFGVCSMALVFVVARLLLRNANAALFATFLYAISPFQIRYAQELRNYTLFTLLGLAALYFFIKAFRDNRKRDWAGLALCEILLLHTHFFSVWLILTINLLFVLVVLIKRDVRLNRILPWLGFQAAAVVVSVPVLLMLTRMAAIVGNIKYHWYQMLSPKIGLIAFKAFFAGFSPNAMAYWPLFTLAACLFVLGLYALRHDWPSALLLALVVAVPLLGNIIMAKLNGFSLFEFRVFIVSGVAACIGVGAGIASLPRRWMQLGVAAAMGLLTFPLVDDYYADRLHPVETHRVSIWSKPDFRAAADYINQHAMEGDIVGHAVHGTFPQMMYYCRLPQVMLGNSQTDRQTLIDTMGSQDYMRQHKFTHEPVQEVAAQVPRIWFLETNGLTFDWPPHVMMMRVWLETFGVREDYQVFNGVSVTCYSTDAARRGAALRDVLADYGEAPLDRYQFADGAPDNQVANAYQEMGQVPCSTFGLQFDITIDKSRGDLHASAPTQADDEFTYRFCVVNRSDADLNLKGTILESAGAVEPLAWVRDDPMAATWRPEPQYDVETNGTFNRPSMVAHFHGAPSPGSIMHGWAALPPGRYTPFARVFEEPNGQAISRAAATFKVEGAADALGTLDGVSQNQAGWHWRALKPLETTGNIVNITAAAYNPRNLPDAYFQLDRIVFVPSDQATGRAPVAQQFDVKLAPYTSRSFEMKGALRGQPRKRIDIELFDPASRLYRSLVFHVQGSNSSGSQ